MCPFSVTSTPLRLPCSFYLTSVHSFGLLFWFRTPTPVSAGDTAQFASIPGKAELPIWVIKGNRKALSVSRSISQLVFNRKNEKRVSVYFGKLVKRERWENNTHLLVWFQLAADVDFVASVSLTELNDSSAPHQRVMLLWQRMKWSCAVCPPLEAESWLRNLPTRTGREASAWSPRLKCSLFNRGRKRSIRPGFRFRMCLFLWSSSLSW